jgi:hypothetical protein
MPVSRSAEFDENQLIAASHRLEAQRRLSNMRKPHVNPRLPALTPEHAQTM